MIKYKAIFLLAVLAVSGCASITGSSSRLVVSNATGEPIRNATVISGGVICYRTSFIPSFKNGKYQGLNNDLVQISTVTWSKVDGTTVSKKADIGRAIPATFRGEVLFEVKKDDSVKVFVTARKDIDTDDKPWGRPADWEATPMMPGMN